MSRTADAFHSVEGYILSETEKAIRIEIHKIDGMAVLPEEQKKEWFPLSQSKSITRQGKGSQELDKIEVSNWILRTKGLA